MSCPIRLPSQTHIPSVGRFLGILHGETAEDRPIEVYFNVSSACSGWIHLNRKDWRAAEEAFIKLIGHPANKKDPYAWLGLGTLNLYSAPTDLRKVCR